ncbi:MAG: hypothetical protein ACLP8S_28210 [Solirubrobacteraceae bacterium]
MKDSRCVCGDERAGRFTVEQHELLVRRREPRRARPPGRRHLQREQRTVGAGQRLQEACGADLLQERLIIGPGPTQADGGAGRPSDQDREGKTPSSAMM